MGLDVSTVSVETVRFRCRGSTTTTIVWTPVPTTDPVEFPGPPSPQHSPLSLRDSNLLLTASGPSLTRHVRPPVSGGREYEHRLENGKGWGVSRITLTGEIVPIDPVHYTQGLFSNRKDGDGRGGGGSKTVTWVDRHSGDLCLGQGGKGRGGDRSSTPLDRRPSPTGGPTRVQ